MLAVLVVRAEGNHTLITVHPGPVPHSARTLAHRLMAAGQGVYWGNLISRAHDPVFMLLIVMWSAIYAWDEAMTSLYTHVTHLEASALVSGLREIEQVSPQVHAIRSHLLWYDALLDHFKKSLEFIGKAGPMASLDEQTQETARILLKKEIKTLLNEVDRLHRQQEMLDDRLSHVMKLVVSILSIKETQASQKHSESMKQMYVAYGYHPTCRLHDPTVHISQPSISPLPVRLSSRVICIDSRAVSHRDCVWHEHQRDRPGLTWRSARIPRHHDPTYHRHNLAGGLYDCARRAPRVQLYLLGFLAHVHIP